MFKQLRVTKSLLERPLVCSNSSESPNLCWKGLWCVQTAQSHQISVGKASGVFKQLRVTKSLLEGLWCVQIAQSHQISVRRPLVCSNSSETSGVFKQLRVTRSLLEGLSCVQTALKALVCSNSSEPPNLC